MTIIQPDKNSVFRALGKSVERLLARVYGKRMAFVLLITHFTEDDTGLADYMSNGTREDCIKWMKETIKRLEAGENQPLDKGITINEH